MSHNYYILKSLNLKEENIFFKDNYLEERFIKGKRSLVYSGYLSYKPEYCYACGIIWNKDIVKHGFKLSKIVLPKVSKLNTYLFLYKQRYKCRHCNKTFFCKTNIVEPSCFISNNTKQSIAEDLTEISSEVDIAKRNNVSPNTVGRVLESYYDDHKIYKDYLPEFISFDEFKSVKSAAGKMSFNMCNAITGKTIDIVENRQLHYLLKYFARYSKRSRNNVKAICIDMYSPYITLIKKMFPNAKIVIDKFHIIQLISRSLNITRVRVMNNDIKNYNKMKRYWRLMLKYRYDLDNSKWRKFICFDHLMTEVDVVDYIIKQHSQLYETYHLYQNLLYSIKNKDYHLFNELISKNYDNISTYMKTSIKTLNEYNTLIKNSFEIDITNARIEGNNNLIKTIKRVSFGFKSFRMFKARIMIVSGLLKLNKKEVNFH